MASLQNAQTLAVQLERVEPGLPILFERDDTLLKMIEVSKRVRKVSMRNMRVPLKMRPGGKYAAHTMDGDDLGLGSGGVYDVAQLTPVFRTFAIQFTELAMYATETDEQAQTNIFNQEVADAMKQFRMAVDAELNTNGNGVLGVITVVSTNTFTLNAAQSAALFYYNQDIQVYDTTLTTNRGTATVVMVDPLLNQIIVNSAPAGTVATDVLVPAGLSGASPVALYGIKYHHQDITTGTWLTLSRPTYPELLKSAHFAAGNAALVPSNYRVVLNKIRRTLGKNAVKEMNLKAYMSPLQAQAYEQLALLVTQIFREPGKGEKEMVDLSYNAEEGTMANVPIVTSIHADNARIDFLALKHWGRAEIRPIGWFTNKAGLKFFQVYGASGGIASAEISYLEVGFQVWMDGPRYGAFIDGLSIPAGN